jgi:peroxiredoxin
MASPSTPLSVGDTAPGFTLKNQHGESVSLADFAGAKNVVLVFYPFAFSGICTGELTEIRDTLEDFQGEDLQVLAISCDPMYSLRAYADANGYFFPLLADFWPHGSVAASYGVLNDLTGGAPRGTFLVDRGGVIRWTLVNRPGDRRDFSGLRAARAAIA